MELQALLQKRLHELPEQIKILKDVYRKLGDEQRKKKLKDLESYEKRMEEGLEFLLNQDMATLNLIESIRHPSPSLLAQNADHYIESLRQDRKKRGTRLSEEELETTMRTLKEFPLTHTTNDVDAVLKDGIHAAS